MKLVKKTDPFTGIEIQLAEFDDGSLLFDTAYTHKSVAIAYNSELNAYMIPANVFDYVDTLTLAETADYLGVSKMRVSTLCARGQLQHSKINGVMLVKYESVLDYESKRNSKKGYERLKNDSIG